MNTRRTRVYIAGPLSKGDLFHNIRQADEAFSKLIKAGYAPMCPHWSVYHGSASQSHDSITAKASLIPGETTYEDWIDTDLSFVEVCDAVLRLPGDSPGADRETEHAEKFGIPVFHYVEILRDVIPANLQSRTRDSSTSDDMVDFSYYESTSDS